MLDELLIPPGVYLDGNPTEFVRFWVCDKEDHVSLKIGLFEPKEREPEVWGTVIADICKHAARALMQDDPAHGDFNTIVARIENGFRNRLMKTTNFSGQLQGTKN
ncbi:MAG: hypothetical protein RL490_2496 [Pseudomonadota bacterium]|jgi:hypothetical protein